MIVTILVGENFANLKETERQKLYTCTGIFKQKLFSPHLKAENKFLLLKFVVYCIFLAGYSVLATPLLMSPILYF
jgi:hypothetical protein